MDEATSPVTIREVRIGRCWNLRGDASNATFLSEAGRLLAPLPAETMTSTRRDDDALLWLGPRSWLFVAGPSSSERDFDATRIAINAAGGALFDVSASYVAWSIAGAGAARVLNRECPLDFSPDAFAPGHCAQSVLGHVNALFYRPGSAPAFVVMIPRSYTADGWHGLTTATSPDGHEEAEAIEFQAA